MYIFAWCKQQLAGWALNALFKVILLINSVTKKWFLFKVGLCYITQNVKRNERMTCGIKMIKLLLIHLTLVVEKEPFGKREAASLEKKNSSVFVSPAWGNANLVLYYFFISCLFCTCQVRTFVHDMIMMLKDLYDYLAYRLCPTSNKTPEINMKLMQNAAQMIVSIKKNSYISYIIFFLEL